MMSSASPGPGSAPPLRTGVGVPIAAQILFAGFPAAALAGLLLGSAFGALTAILVWTALASLLLAFLHWRHIDRRLRRGRIVIAPVLGSARTVDDDGVERFHFGFRITMPGSGETIEIVDHAASNIPVGHRCSIMTDPAYAPGHPMRAQRITFDGIQAVTFLLLMLFAASWPLALWQVLAMGWIDWPAWPA